jgi:predicted transcriptional regulator
MPKTVRDVPPPLELECLNALWTLGEGNVKQVREIVTASRPLAYTTIMTVLDRLVRKGKLDRHKAGRAYVYAPRTARDDMRRTAIRELLAGFFGGSESELLRFLGAEPAAAPQSRAARSAVAVEEAGIDTVLL